MLRTADRSKLLLPAARPLRILLQQSYIYYTGYIRTMPGLQILRTVVFVERIYVNIVDVIPFEIPP